ncbi:precorrin-6A reductase [Caproiciproducens faecalis]|uniref:Precorrin-6A reductase n=1 Tax=Caproiciproducens faecalis TaxID=2820301 RepID=A0ABS7DJ17_9FIRM|nr:precorrin-6A reductase [Caproiciproducens faecalis]MBW7571287.1 precorrin-6A reductase [Caproiciproducens faecalis]
MKQILIFSGTTEGRRLAELLCANGLECTVCVATQYGELVMEKRAGLTVHQGRMTPEEMRSFLSSGDFLAVVDATHPFATAVSENIRSSMAESPIPLLRLQRDTEYLPSGEKNIFRFPTHENCAEALKEIPGNILLTTGSKDLAAYSEKKELLPRLYARVLPSLESLSLCYENGIEGKHILAMQGPFSVEMNEAMLRQYDIRCMVTKESGGNGGFPEKIQAARSTGTKVLVIGNPENEQGDSFEAVCAKLEDLTGKKLRQDNRMQIALIGVGMGNPAMLTKEAERKIQGAELLFGARRLLAKIPGPAEKVPCYLAEEILPYLKEKAVKKAAVLFSGDTGFYSGAQKLYATLQKEIGKGAISAQVELLPGISSVSCLAAKLGISWHDAEIVSIHGRSANVADAVRTNPKTFLLVSGLVDMKALGALFHGMENIRITAGYQLSYPEEEILRLNPADCAALEKDGLYVCLIENPQAGKQRLTHGFPDSDFLRDRVPMTKEEVREVSVCKLRLTRDAVLYDIGSGTGSVAVECAALSDRVQVYAIEKKKEAVLLTEQNRAKFGLTNLTVVEGEAPSAFEGLPAPTHAFLGGTGGNMKEILAALYRKNPQLRVVVNAVTLETLGEITGLLKTLPVEQEEIVQIQVGRAETAGRYHLMRAENPVFIISFTFEGNGEKDE